MRIISGNFKGKKLLISKDKHTRPLKDNVKESIFNILEHSKLINYKISNSNILDLFSGFGSFGLECISRNSKHVTFFENYPSTLKILKQNIKSLNCYKNTKIIEKDIFDIGRLNLDLTSYEFIFLDPPYKENRIKFILTLIKDSKILRKDSIILIHRDKKFADEFPKDFKLIMIKKYGRSKIFFGKFN